MRLAREFYARVGQDSELRPLFPGKSLRCAIEEFSAFLVQFLEGDESKTQYRWWLSLRESHARFKITESQRSAWLRHMHQAIEASVPNTETRRDLAQFFGVASAAIVGRDEGDVQHDELQRRWRTQNELDRLIREIEAKHDELAITLAKSFLHRRTVTVGIFARMMDTGRSAFNDFIQDCIRENPDLATANYNGRSLLHHAAAAHCVPVVRQLIDAGVNPDSLDTGGHTPLYRAANARFPELGVEVVNELLRAGATVDHPGGVNRSTPLHEAARHGAVQVAEALLRAGADVGARDRKGLTPIDRARNLRRSEIVDLLTGSVMRQAGCLS